MRDQPGDTWGDKMRERLQKELPTTAASDGDSGDDDEASRLLEQFSSNTMYTYRLAEGLVSDALREIAAKADNGRISIDRVDADQRELLTMYSESQDSWQEVCLVLTGDSVRDVASTAVVINRPLAKGMSRPLAELLLNGQGDSATGRYGAESIDRMISAFGTECAIYLGGPEQQDTPGLLVHGFELPGATELAPGTRIFTGGVEAAIDAVLSGERQPLDFRWFVGRREDLSTGDASYVPIACARPVALKQCLGLPKPLWHEVLELCGGEMAEMSAVELTKRPDLD